MVESLTRDGRVVGSSLTVGPGLGPSVRQINPCLVLGQPRKTRPDMTEKCRLGHIELNQTKKQQHESSKVKFYVRANLGYVFLKVNYKDADHSLQMSRLVCAFSFCSLATKSGC